MSCLHQRSASMPRSRACDALGLARTGTYRRIRSRRNGQPDAAVQPRELSEAERERIREQVTSEPYQDQSVRAIHATELNAGRLLASVSTYYRILRADRQIRERRHQRPAQHHARPRVLAERPNESWTWDITKLPTIVPRTYLNLYLVLDLLSRFPVAWMISTKENAALAQHLFRQALEQHKIEPGQLTVHQDRGAPMIAHSYREFLDGFGVRRSYSRPRVSNDNPFSEAVNKTLKYAPSYPGRFRGMEHAREWVAAFMQAYQHRPHEGLCGYTPHAVFHGHVDAIAATRQAALDAHYARHPQRYPRGAPTTQRPPAVVAINPGDGLTTAADFLNDAVGGRADPPLVETPAAGTITQEKSA